MQSRFLKLLCSYLVVSYSKQCLPMSFMRVSSIVCFNFHVWFWNFYMLHKLHGYLIPIIWRLNFANFLVHYIWKQQKFNLLLRQLALTWKGKKNPNNLINFFKTVNLQCFSFQLKFHTLNSSTTCCGIRDIKMLETSQNYLTFWPTQKDNLYLESWSVLR